MANSAPNESKEQHGHRFERNTANANQRSGPASNLGWAKEGAGATGRPK